MNGPMRTPLIAGNWKMFKTVNEAVVFVKDLRDLVKGISGVDIVVAPPTSAPSTSGSRINSAMLSGLTLPP